ncbi:M48 family metallopeptidase [Ginsengibacter hankyongi]|uniref:M48 family metallopeptidase n=1 Tax=Ginsengibacter hankyongi TaxID=2607284 RepID=A0A5J5IFG7_9BACT|nr:M48 family metallopeptidase [Ginsengibacter hankyongi]KAA9038593.1 M48 family metallopeptidase [Ginsengibacter hankyongi]
MKNIFLLLVISSIFITACTTNAITGRSQLSLVSEESLQKEAVTQYNSILSKNTVVSNTTNKDAEMVKRVGKRIAAAITKYYSDKGLSKELAGYNWEFNLIDSKEVNAWCMPGGKVAVYTGLLPVTQNEAALAIVLGHEITHAVAHHGQERMSQALVAQGIGLTGDIFTSGNGQANNIFKSIYAPGAQVAVLLPNSRKQEYEADHYGLIFAAMAGYNPREAVPFWTRMASLNSGSKTPEILSDHPLDAKRIEKIKTYMPEALKYYQPINSK